MKKFLFLFCLFLATATNAQTTEEEFNYITRGYKIQLENGLDMKKGYEFKDIYQGYEMEFHVEAKALHKIGYLKPRAIMIILSSNENPTIKYYYCVPSLDSDKKIIDRFKDTIMFSNNKRNLYFTLAAQRVIASYTMDYEHKATMDIYNYIVKGYSIQKEAGLDMKEGYEFKDIYSKELGAQFVTAKGLHRIGDAKPMAIMLEIKAEKMYYFCIPFLVANSLRSHYPDVLAKTRNDILHKDKEKHPSLAWVLALSTAQIAFICANK